MTSLGFSLKKAFVLRIKLPVIYRPVSSKNLTDMIFPAKERTGNFS